jgi:hypothetical protein
MHRFHPKGEKGRKAPMTSIRDMLHSAIDYAGLFAPANLEMSQAVQNYADYRTAESSWALGRFVIPASRLVELPDSKIDQTWSFSILLGTDPNSDLDSIRTFQRRFPASIHSLEAKAMNEADMDRILNNFPNFMVYFEVPIGDNLSELVGAIGRRNGRAKCRTGGIRSELFPSPSQLSRFLICCAEKRVPFKATAGLHHAIRWTYPLTYERASLFATMHGFVNLLLASAAAFAGFRQEIVELILAEENKGSFHFGENGVVRWQEWNFPNRLIREMRQGFLVSFGSCSFLEPIADMKDLGFL